MILDKSNASTGVRLLLLALLLLSFAANAQLATSGTQAPAPPEVPDNLT